MKDKIRTLIVDSGGYKLRTVLTSTLFYGILGFDSSLRDFPDWLLRNSIINYLTRRQYDALSYVNDWREAFYRRDDLDILTINLENLIESSKILKKINEFSLIIVLHSATGDNMTPLLNNSNFFQKRHGKLVVFLGNEYDLMREKFAFLQKAGADYVCSQLPLPAAQWLYESIKSVKIVSLPHALNPQLYNPGNEQRRVIDIGFRGALYSRFIGDEERNNFILFMQQIAPQRGMIVDFSYKTIHRQDWAYFLRHCKGIVGGESGTYYLDREGLLLFRAKKYVQQHPHATIEEIKEACFNDATEYMSGKCISSRHFEPIGTKTCQILLEGDYNGILKADEHYISVKKDYSNIEDVITRFMDEDYRKAIVEKAYEYIISHHTYDHRVNDLMQVLVQDGLGIG